MSKGNRLPVETIETITKDNGKQSNVVYHSYVLLLTEKDGSEVKAVRFHTDKKKSNKDFNDDFHKAFPDWNNWNIKGCWRLYEDDFKS